MSENSSLTSKGSLQDCTFTHNDGKTFLRDVNGSLNLFADFSLKLLGEIWLNPTEAQCAHVASEGQWLASMTGFVFSTKFTRLVSLKGSDFDTKRSLLEALRRGFPGGSVSFWPGIKNEHVNGYWHWLVGQYDPAEGVKLYGTSHLGQHEDNYWVLSEEVHIWRNGVVQLHERKFHLMQQLHDYATSMNFDLLKKDVLQDVCKRLLNVSTYLGCNHSQFLLVLGFCISRLMRSQNLDDVWGESNIGLMYSSSKNCGKSMTLYLLSKLQGIASRHHPLLLSGGNQSTSGTSAKKILEILSKTTLFVMMDDPLISTNLGEFLNQIQGGLLQGSAASGMFAPRGSVLLTSNDEEVERIEGRVQRFTFVRDEAFDLSEQREHALMALAEDNKGLLLAWTVRFMPLWIQLSSKHIDVLQRAIRSYFPLQQIRWIRGFSYTLLAKAMFLASAERKSNIIKDIEEQKMISLAQTVTLLPVMIRFQKAVLEKIRGETGKVHTWINPYCSVKLMDGRVDKAVAFSKMGMNLLNSDVSMNEIDTFLKKNTLNGISQPITFAVDGNTPLAAIRSKKAGDSSVTSRRAHKIPLGVLDSCFMEWLRYALGLTKDRPEDEFVAGEGEEYLTEEGPSHELCEEVSLLEETIDATVRAFKEDPRNNDHTPPSGKSVLEESTRFVKNLSPAAKQLFDTFTPRRKRAFEMGTKAASKRVETVTVGTLTSPFKVTESTQETSCVPTCSTSVIEAEETPEQPPNKVTLVRTRKQLFPEGASGVLLRQPIHNSSAVTSRTKDKCNKCKKVACGKAKSGAEQKWIACDCCNKWYHIECSGLDATPEKEESWHCCICSKKK